MTGKATQLITQIRTRVKNPITKKPQFKNNDEVIEWAVQNLYDEFKKNRML